MKNKNFHNRQWLDYIVDVDKDYFHNEVNFDKLPLDKLAIKIKYMLEDYESKLLYVHNQIPKLYPLVLAQFKDFYYYCLTFIEKRLENLDPQFYDIQRLLDENLLICHGTLKDAKDNIIYDINNKYEQDTPYSFKVGESLTNPVIAEFQDRVMAQLVCMFPRMRQALTKEYALAFDDDAQLYNGIENAKLVEKLNEYATLYDQALRYEDIMSLLNHYASIFKVITTTEEDNLVYLYNQEMMDKANAMQLYIEEEKQSHNILTILMHLVVDYDFLSVANSQNTVIDVRQNKNRERIIGQYACMRIGETVQRFSDIQEYLYPIINSPYYSYFNLENFKDHNVFWQLDKIIKNMIEYLYSPTYEKVVRFQKLEDSILDFKNDRYPRFMQDMYPRKQEQLQINKRKKVIAKMEQELFKVRNQVQIAFEEAGISNNQKLEQDQQNEKE